MAYLESRTTPLNQKEVSDFLTDHLLYRIKILDTVYGYPNKVNTDPYWPSVYESAQIICRMFIQFFGFGIEKGDPPKLKPDLGYYPIDKNSFEVKIKDLNINFIELNELTQKEQDLLAHAYQAGNRATAHLTHGHSFVADPQKVLEASQVIRNLIKSKLNI
jgi:hypothetical protein